jgi:secondary thiamine-phosphate synthase enzyme
MQTLEIRTARRNQLVDITRQVREAVRNSGVSEGVAHLWSFHTTCGLTVNEGADPDVARDLEWKLTELVPEDESSYRHAEGNSDLALGTWQAVFLCEFDGPRLRKVGLQVVPAGG